MDNNVQFGHLHCNVSTYEECSRSKTQQPSAKLLHNPLSEMEGKITPRNATTSLGSLYSSHTNPVFSRQLCAQLQVPCSLEVTELRVKPGGGAVHIANCARRWSSTIRSGSERDQSEFNNRRILVERLCVNSTGMVQIRHQKIPKARAI